MDDKSISQSSELTEQVHRRRLSSILKAPRSPLKDLGSGNELCQEPIIEKHRKSLRRVSFAETIRVFTPALQSTGSADKENEGFGTSESSTNVNKETANKCGIAGMDTLLHGAIQAPSYNADEDWNNADCTEDRTIFFCADNDMDMTASNTIPIHGLIEKKIDTSQFLASLKFPNNEMTQNKDFKLSVGVEKHSDFILKRDSSMENKVKFSDFLTSLANEKSKATNFLDAEKENIFPFVPTRFHALDSTENVTQMFREQDDGLDLTKCHTTNIDSFFPMINRETANQLTSSHNGNSQPERLALSELSHLKNFGLNNKLNRSASNNQTVFIEDDMDITRSHTTRIRQDALAQAVQLHTYQNETQFPFDKNMIFDKENEMEMTRNNSVLIDKNPSVTSVQRKIRVSCEDHTTILPQGEDMDITKSHTVAIDGLTVEQVRPQAMPHSAVCSGVANDHVRRSSGLALNPQMVPRKSLEMSNTRPIDSIQSGFEHNRTYASKLEDPEDQVNQAEQNKTGSTFSNLEPSEKMLENHTKSANNERPKSHTIAVDGKPLQEMSKKDSKSNFNCLKLPSVSNNKTNLFSTDSDDMELTQSHTVFIDQKALNRDNKNDLSVRFQQRDTSVSTSGQVEKTDRDLRVQENTSLVNRIPGSISSKHEPMMNATNYLTDDMEITVFGNDAFGKSPPSSAYEGNKTALFTCSQQDMEFTRSQTVFIDHVLCERLQYDTCSTISNDLHFNSTISKCTSTNIKEQVGYSVAKEQEAETLSKSLFELQSACVNPGHAMPSESTREVCTALQNNSNFLRPDQDDMDITLSNTAAIRNTFLYGNSKPNKSVPCVPSTLNSSATDKSVFEDDMELTKSHTMIIDERNLVGLRNPSTSIKNITLPTSAPKMVTNPIAVWHEIDPTHNVSKQQLHNESVPQEGDMEMTNINTGLLIAARKSQSWNKVNPSFESQDKTVYLCDQDDMDMTRAHTVAIENKVIEVKDANLKSMSQDSATVSSAKSHLGDVKYMPRPYSAHDFDEKHYTSRTPFDPEMDITVSNTVTINTEKPGNDLQLLISKSKVLPSAKSHYLDRLERDEGNNTVFDQESRTDLKKNSPELQDKTLFLYEQNDMDITRSHTTAIESKILNGLKDKKVEPEFQKLTERNADLTNNGINMAGNITSVTGACSEDEDMDMTKSNTVFIDQLHTKDVHVSDIHSKGKIVSSLQKSLIANNETSLLVYNMEETNRNVHLSESLVNGSSFDKPTCNQSDIEMTKSHTVAIEKPLDSAHITYPVSICSQVSTAMTSCDQGNNYMCGERDRARPPAEANDGPRAESVEPLVFECISYKELSMPPDPKDTTTTFSGNVKGSDLTKLQGNSGLVQTSKDFLDGDETMFPNEQSMDITKAHTAAEACSLDNNSRMPSTGIVVIEGDTVNVSGALIDVQQKCDLNETMEKLKCRRKSYARSGILLAGLENEVSRIHTNSIEASLLKTNTDSCGSAEKDFILDKESDNIDFESKHTYFGNCISPNADPNQNPTFPEQSCVSSACKVVGLEEDNVPDDKICYEKGLKSQLEIKGENLKTTSEGRSDISFNCDPSCLASDPTANMRPEKQKTCVRPLETLTVAHQKDSEVAVEKEMKKAKLKGKRVSFHVPEIEMVSKDQVIQPFVSHRDNYDEVEHQDRIVHAADQIATKSDFMDQASVIGIKQDTENLEDNPLHKDSDVTSDMAVGFPERISSNVAFSTLFCNNSAGINKRRSIADIQLKIKRLSQQSKTSHTHTAPLLGLIEQLPATAQILHPSGSERVLLNAELPNTVTTQEKEPIHEKNKITRGNSLPNRLSVKMIQPKLPKKRALSTSNNVEEARSTVSEAEHQNAQCSKALLKTFKVLDDGQCIDEEMLPACPDDQDINSVFHYEVPEGAWEELCQEEAVQQNSDRSTMQCKDSVNGQKRVREAEGDFESQREKRARWKDDILEKDEARNSVDFKGSDKLYRSDSSTHHASKTMEQTYSSSSSSQDSRADGMSVDLSSQQYSQMDSQLPWDTGCEQNLWKKFQDGTITVQEFFVLLRIRVLIQKPRYSELPSKRGMKEDLTAIEILQNQYIHQPKLQMYEEECHTLYQTIEELKGSTELQHKPLVQINSFLWEALRMCSENELMYFGVTLKNMKSLYSKKSKLIAHEEKVSTYSKLLHTAQTQWENLQARLHETDELLTELDNCISTLELETTRLNEECGSESLAGKGCVRIQAEIDCLKSQEQLSIRESLELEERKQVLGQLDCLQEEERVNRKHLQELSYTEWELVEWTDQAATFIFLYNSLELSVTFGDSIDGECFNKKPCRKISSVTVESQLDDEVAHPSSVLVHRLILQYVEKAAFNESYKNQNNLPQLLSNLSLVVSRCKLLGEELEYLIKWGAKYNIVKTQVQSLQIKLLFSSLAALVKFELIIHLSDTYPTVPLAFTLNNLIGSIT
ncbi:hypothetical protein GDO78_010258 [Eleutherodactylus coqui]|nr:hypothetical protein GDO78_010258 [Eleutherodactylus coqui]